MASMGIVSPPVVNSCCLQVLLLAVGCKSSRAGACSLVAGVLKRHILVFEATIPYEELHKRTI